jgi:hypothetical protein
MAETMTEVRADIEKTRARMAGAIAELEKKADIAEKVREHPWAALAIAFGAGLALSRSPAEVKAPQVAVDATRQTGNKLGSAFDQVVTAAIGGIVGALHSRVDDVVASVVKTVQPAQRVTPPSATAAGRPVGTAADYTIPEVPLRAD